MNLPISSVVIMGGGTAGWMTANLLAKNLKFNGLTITLVESSTIGTIGVGEGTSPFILRFFDEMGFDESEWMPACNATFKLGIEFNGWCDEEGLHSYSHPFFGNLDRKSGAAFIRNCNLRRQGVMVDTNPTDFLLGSMLSCEGKSPYIEGRAGPGNDYAYHFDAGLVADFLKKKAKELGVIHVVDTVKRVKQLEGGNIESLLLDSGREIKGDYFFDCSGFASILIGKTLNTPFRSISDRILNDSAVAMPTENKPGVIKSLTSATALSAGWAWKIPLTHRCGNGYVYSSSHLTNDQAESEFRSYLSEDGLDDARHLKMRLGRYDVSWKNNCVGIGLSQGFVEPLEATAIVYAYQCISIFIKLLQKGDYTTEYQAQYNQYVNIAFDTIVDYIHLHYLLNTRNDTPYWEQVRQTTPSDRLKYILDAWDNPKADFLKALEVTQGQVTFPPTSWSCLLSGKGRYPRVTKKPAKKEVNKVMARKFISELSAQFVDQRKILEDMR